ncbi:MAG: L,D-transpeptidase family protein [Pseudomonadota bacterium]
MFSLFAIRRARIVRQIRSGALLTAVAAMAACSATSNIHRAPPADGTERPLRKPEMPTKTLAETRSPIQPAFYAPQEQPAYRGIPQVGKAILVNIPSFELIAFEDGEPVLRSRVIVGKPSTPTPVMQTETSVVRFRPTWTPTPRMIRSGKYRAGTRPPGKRNPLGFLAIRLAPGMLIYLHGTNKPQLFDKEHRALSHGCVRVEKWDEVAAWVLGLPVEEVHTAAYGRRTFDAQTEGIPVILSYQLNFPTPDGTPQRWEDVYRRGAETILAQAL